MIVGSVLFWGDVIDVYSGRKEGISKHIHPSVLVVWFGVLSGWCTL